jgi:membrane protein CcdC involved in cytochrome C biogenesis
MAVVYAVALGQGTRHVFEFARRKVFASNTVIYSFILIGRLILTLYDKYGICSSIVFLT